jgi:hypothetical protein
VRLALRLSERLICSPGCVESGRPADASTDGSRATRPSHGTGRRLGRGRAPGDGPPCAGWHILGAAPPGRTGPGIGGPQRRPEYAASGQGCACPGYPVPVRPRPSRR